VDEIASRLAEKWGFSPTEELPAGHCSRVYADATRVLKVPFRGEEMSSGWRAALLLSGGIGPEVFEHDSETGSLLMERVVPGTTLADSGLSDEDCLEIVLGFAAQMRGLPAEGMLPLSEYFDRDSMSLRWLDASSPEKVFLHGDLHHFNILWDERKGWRVIDPKGLVGDPSFEMTAFLRNPIPYVADWPGLSSVFEQRLARMDRVPEVEGTRVLAWQILDEPDPGSPWEITHQVMGEMLDALGGTFSFEGQEIPYRPFESVLDALLRAKVRIGFSCRVGDCLSCLARCESGTLSPESQEGLTGRMKQIRTSKTCSLRAVHVTKMTRLQG